MWNPIKKATTVVNVYTAEEVLNMIRAFRQTIDVYKHTKGSRAAIVAVRKIMRKTVKKLKQK